MAHPAAGKDPEPVLGRQHHVNVPVSNHAQSPGRRGPPFCPGWSASGQFAGHCLCGQVYGQVLGAGGESDGDLLSGAGGGRWSRRSGAGQGQRHLRAVPRLAAGGQLAAVREAPDKGIVTDAARDAPGV